MVKYSSKTNKANDFPNANNQTNKPNNHYTYKQYTRVTYTI